MTEELTGEWRPIVAALANDDARAAFARIVLRVEDDPYAGLSPSRRRHVRQQLLSARMIRDEDGRDVENPDAFTHLLQNAAVRRRTGVERFLDEGGRIMQYPARPSERHELLQWVAARVLSSDDVVSEREITERLASFTDDTAALRRYLVDAELVERTATGSEYSLVESP